VKADPMSEVQRPVRPLGSCSYSNDWPMYPHAFEAIEGDEDGKIPSLIFCTQCGDTREATPRTDTGEDRITNVPSTRKESEVKHA
jgi:hypothetical protein